MPEYRIERPPHRTKAECPTCGQIMLVSELTCLSCETQVRGQFRLTRFDRLSDEQLVFLERFLRARGNIRDVERETGLSYPTVRNRLDNVLHALELDEGQSAGSTLSEQAQIELLEALSQGTTDVNTVLSILAEERTVEGSNRANPIRQEENSHE